MDWNELKHKRVIAHRILVDKPQHSGTEYGYIFELGARDLNKREPCGAVGKVAEILSDGILLLWFLSTYPVTEEDNYLSTFAYAHPDDVEQTDAGYSWPTNDGLVVDLMRGWLIQTDGAYHIYHPIGEPAAPVAQNEDV